MMSENRTAIANANIKLVKRSEISVGPSKNCFQMIVPVEPDIKDAITPALENFFQNNNNNNTGPNDEPIPDHAYDTNPNIDSTDDIARKKAARPTTSVMILLNHNAFFSDIFFFE